MSSIVPYNGGFRAVAAHGPVAAHYTTPHSRLNMSATFLKIGIDDVGTGQIVTVGRETRRPCCISPRSSSKQILLVGESINAILKIEVEPSKSIRKVTGIEAVHGHPGLRAKKA
ncbi:MAG: hypothetical protein ABIQ38_06395 [Ilumatobacteraceae bacterium]